MSDSILARNRQIKNFSSRYDSMPWVAKLPAQRSRGVRSGLQERAWSSTSAGLRRAARFRPERISSRAACRASPLHHEMEMLVESGLTPMQALKAATSWSAEILEGKNKARGARQDRLDPRRQFCRPRGRQRRSRERHLQHQEDRTGDEERTLGRARLSSRNTSRSRSARARSRPRPLRRRSARSSQAR